MTKYVRMTRRREDKVTMHHYFMRWANNAIKNKDKQPIIENKNKVASGPPHGADAALKFLRSMVERKTLHDKFDAFSKLRNLPPTSNVAVF